MLFPIVNIKLPIFWQYLILCALIYLSHLLLFCKLINPIIIAIVMCKTLIYLDITTLLSFRVELREMIVVLKQLQQQMIEKDLSCILTGEKFLLIYLR